jgi:hypothetical protein
LGYSKVCARWVPWSLTTEHRHQGKPSVLNCWSILMLRGGLFVPDRHRWWNLGSSLWAGDEKSINGAALSVNRKRAGTGKACMLLFHTGVRH